MADTLVHEPVDPPWPCIPDHGVMTYCHGCELVCSSCRDEDDMPVIWPCQHAAGEG